MKKYILITTGDIGDGDYIIKTTYFTEDKLSTIISLINKLKIVKNIADKYRYLQGEVLNSLLDDVYYKEVFNEDMVLPLSEEIYKILGMCPCTYFDGENIHTIVDIQLVEYTNIKNLF